MCGTAAVTAVRPGNLSRRAYSKEPTGDVGPSSESFHLLSVSTLPRLLRWQIPALPHIKSSTRCNSVPPPCPWSSPLPSSLGLHLSLLWCAFFPLRIAFLCGVALSAQRVPFTSRSAFLFFSRWDLLHRSSFPFCQSPQVIGSNALLSLPPHFFSSLPSLSRNPLFFPALFPPASFSLPPPAFVTPVTLYLCGCVTLPPGCCGLSPSRGPNGLTVSSPIQRYVYGSVMQRGLERMLREGARQMRSLEAIRGWGGDGGRRSQRRGGRKG